MKYLLPCKCGVELEVEPSQAGKSVACGCGLSVEAPPLRQLRQLPAALSTGVERPVEGWDARHGVLTACLLTAMVVVGIAVSMWAVEPAMPKGFDPLLQADMVESGLESISPAEAYQKWFADYKPMDKFGELTDPREAALRNYLTRRQVFRLGLFSLAALIAAGGISAFVLLPKSPA